MPSLLYRTATSSGARLEESREKKSRAESRRSEVSLRLRLLPPVARRSEHTDKRKHLSFQEWCVCLDSLVRESGFFSRVAAIFRQCFNYAKIIHPISHPNYISHNNILFIILKLKVKICSITLLYMITLQ